MAGQSEGKDAMSADRKRVVRTVIRSWVRKRGWGYKTPRNGLRRRLYSLAYENHQWWDWGHRLMILTGTDVGGNWAEPTPETIWYRRVPTKPMRRTGYPRTKFEVITDYRTFTERTKGLNEDQMYEWQAIGVGQDGGLHLGHQYWGGRFFELRKDEAVLVRRYLRRWHRLDWFGARSWLYSQALHAAVHQRKPLTCQVTPPKGSGGYSHWYCDQPRRHKGEHRYRSYTWDGDVEHKVEYAPVDQERSVIEEAERVLDA